MQSVKKHRPGDPARKGKRSAGEVLLLILKIFGTLALVAATTALIFACIFLIYVKTNLSSELNVSLDDFTMNESSTIYYKDAGTGDYKELVSLQSGERRIWVDYDQMPVNIEHALVAIEDKRFYEHHGVDWYRTFGAFVNMFFGMKDNFGGSTITQQLIKNLTEDNEITVQRKLLEIFRALQFEKKYSKKQIVEWYLNVVYFGYGCYGIGAAANYYFGKDVKDLTLAECASIIAITNNPSIYSPYASKSDNKQRQENILNEMYAQGYIGKDELTEAKSETLHFKKGDDSTGTSATYTWFEDAVIEDVINDIAAQKGCSYRTAENLVYTNGYKIYCTLDPSIQAKADSVYQDLSAIPKVSGSKQQIQSSIVIANPYTGDIVALEGGVGPKTGNRLLNRATQSKRPPGSSIKPLSVYGPAIEYRVITPNTRFNDTADARLKGSSWMPKNDSLTYSGNIDVRTALRNSVNTVSAQILDRLTPAVSFDFLTKKLGLPLDAADKDYAPLALGQLTHGLTVRDEAMAYTMFPNAGIETHLRLYTKITDSNDNVIIDNKPATSAAISDVTAYWMTSMLEDAATNGTGYEANLGFMPTAGKTGTSTDKKDRWFAGYTPYYVAVVWTGYDTPAAMTVSGNPSAQLWNKVMTLVHKDLPAKDFNKPASTELDVSPSASASGSGNSSVDETITYTVRGVTVDGQVLYEDAKTANKGSNVTEEARDIDSYRLVGSDKKTITVSGDASKDIILFFYELSDGTSPSAEPSGEGTTSPAPDSPSPESPTPSETPTSEPSKTPEASPSPTDEHLMYG